MHNTNGVQVLRDIILIFPRVLLSNIYLDAGFDFGLLKPGFTVLFFFFVK